MATRWRPRAVCVTSSIRIRSVSNRSSASRMNVKSTSTERQGTGRERHQLRAAPVARARRNSGRPVPESCGGHRAGL